MQLTKRLVMSAAGAVVGVGLVGLLVAKHFEPPPRPYVPTAVARVGDVESDVLATGSVEPANVVDVGSEVSGRVMSLKVAVGDTVKKGDLIAIVDPSRLTAQVQQQQTSIAQAQANLRDRLAQLDIARKEVDRQKTLLERGVSSQATYDIAVANLNSGIAQTENQRQQIANEQLILEQRQADLDKSNIRAPIDGIVESPVKNRRDRRALPATDESLEFGRSAICDPAAESRAGAIEEPRRDGRRQGWRDLDWPVVLWISGIHLAAL
ncbi:MAG: biotin/lipoyl-binding protein, partial [Alphaproteobacteria bacterium]